MKNRFVMFSELSTLCCVYWVVSPVLCILSCLPWLYVVLMWSLWVEVNMCRFIYLLFTLKKKFKQRWSTIPSISTKQATTSNVKPLNTKQTTCGSEIQVLVWDIDMVGLNPLMGSSPSHNLIFNDYSYKQIIFFRPAQIPFHSKRLHQHKNERQHRHHHG